MSEAPDDPSSRPGGLVFIAIFLLFALFLLSQLGAETKFSAKGQLFAQPRFWPAVGLIAMVAFGAAHFFFAWAARTGGEVREVAFWLRSIEYLAWFMVYVAVVPVIGYLAATLLFTVLLAFRQGYRGAGHLGAAAALGLAIVLVFKTGLAVKIPGGAVYEYLPSGLRSFMIVNF